MFIPFPKGLDRDFFSDYDDREGFSNCLYVPGGIVVTKGKEDEYKELVRDAYNFFK